MDAIDMVTKLITDKYKNLQTNKEKYQPGVQLCLAWLAGAESAGEIYRTCKDCRHAYVPKHSRNTETVFCEEMNLPKMIDGYCDWFQEDK